MIRRDIKNLVSAIKANTASIAELHNISSMLMDHTAKIWGALTNHLREINDLKRKVANLEEELRILRTHNGKK